jgi:hypothetical protein
MEKDLQVVLIIKPISCLIISKSSFQRRNSRACLTVKLMHGRDLDTPFGLPGRVSQTHSEILLFLPPDGRKQQTLCILVIVYTNCKVLRQGDVSSCPFFIVQERVREKHPFVM